MTDMFRYLAPTRNAVKRVRQKLKTFTTKIPILKKKTSVTKGNYATEVCLATPQDPKWPTIKVIQSCPYPLAITKETGSVRQWPKSTVHEAFVKDQ